MDIYTPDQIDLKPQTEEDRHRVLTIIRDQTTQIYTDGTVQCPCGHVIAKPSLHSYRCYFCMVVLCKQCAKRHFS
jgi:hypothetical protein